MKRQYTNEKRELYSIFRHWSFSSESKRKLEKFLCEQCIDVCMWRIFFIIFSTLMKKMPRSNWCTTWTALNIKLSHLQIDLSHKMFLCIALHPQRWNNHCQNYENMMHEFRKLMHTQALIFLFLVHFLVENWNIVNEVLNIPLKIDVTKFPCEWVCMCVRVCVTKTFECHYYYYFWPRFHFTIYIALSLTNSVFIPFFVRCVIANNLPMQNVCLAVSLVWFGLVCHGIVLRQSSNTWHIFVYTATEFEGSVWCCWVKDWKNEWWHHTPAGCFWNQVQTCAVWVSQQYRYVLCALCILCILGVCSAIMFFDEVMIQSFHLHSHWTIAGNWMLHHW